MSMVALFALSFDLLLITGLASGVLVVLCLRILGSVLLVLDVDAGRSDDAAGGGA